MDDRRKNYRAWDSEQGRGEPVSPRDALPEDDLVFFLLDLMPHLDLGPFHDHYARELRGQPPFDVTMMVTRADFHLIRVGPEGVEPSSSGSQPSALPLSYGPMLGVSLICWRWGSRTPRRSLIRRGLCR